VTALFAPVSVFEMPSVTLSLEGRFENAEWIPESERFPIGDSTIGSCEPASPLRKSDRDSSETNPGALPRLDAVTEGGTFLRSTRTVFAGLNAF
jgi:hypothetical protein